MQDLYYTFFGYRHNVTDKKFLPVGILYQIPELEKKDFLIVADYKKVSEFDPTLNHKFLKQYLSGIKSYVKGAKLFDIFKYIGNFKKEFCFNGIKGIKIDYSNFIVNDYLIELTLGEIDWSNAGKDGVECRC